MASDPETRIVGNRLGVWFALGAFSSIALIALVTRYDSFEDEQAVIKWALATFCIAIGMAGLALIATVAVSDKFTSTKGEGVMALIALIFLSIGLPSIMNVSNQLAVNSDGSIRDGNLYFFSWFSLFAAVLVFLSYISDSRGMGFGSIFSWPFLCLTSFVVMAAAIDLLNEEDWCEGNETEFCSRARFAAALGGICGCFSLLWTFVASRLPQMLDQILSILVSVPWAAAVAVLTFGGRKAPGREVGSLFFFTWASFGIAFMMALGAASGLLSSRSSTTSTTDDSTKQKKKKPAVSKSKKGDVESS